VTKKFAQLRDIAIKTGEYVRACVGNKWFCGSWVSWLLS